ncbi:MAG: hypothetical protein LBE13_10090 [Bacteroidales bacterium]|jgi:hypothetical protein|nr:hypothetical protein [Bacteroidales bacterium]
MKKLVLITVILAFAANTFAAGAGIAGGGSINKTTSGYEITYFITDHLESVRVITTSSGEIDEIENCTPSWPVGRKANGKVQTWKNGRPYFAPLWIGYRSGNQITRIGYSHKIVHNMTQNMVHKFMNTPYYMSYDEFRRGGYFYTGYRNPFSLWER